MSILIIFNYKDPKPWQKILSDKISGEKIEIYPEVIDTNSVHFAICWKPENNVLAQFKNLEVVQSAGAAIEHITNTQKLTNNIKISRVVDFHLSNDMYEFLLAAVLSYLKKISDYSYNQAHKKWKPTEYNTINSKNIAILGLGEIGGYVAKMFGDLGFKVKGWSASKKNIPNVKSFVGESELSAFLKDSDILINLLPLTNQTEGILNMKNLRQLNKEAFLINVGRGEHLIDDDLIELLDDSFISGALLDVFRNEPLPESHPFWTHSKIRITPHIASVTNIESVSNQIVENYKRYIENKELLNTVSLIKGY